MDRILRDSNPMPIIPTEGEAARESAGVTDIILACLLRLANMRPQIADIQTLFQEKFSNQYLFCFSFIILIELQFYN